MAGEVFRGLDIFSEAIPTFILQGKKKVQTRVGGVATILLVIIVFMYAALKFSYLITRHKPEMFTYFKDNTYSLNNEQLNLGARNFRIAVTIEDYFPPIAQKNDLRFVKWMFRMVIKRNGVWTERILPYHKCTDADHD